MQFSISWQRYLSLILLTLGVTALGFSLISWIAANWYDLSTLQKLYGMQFFVFALGLGSLVAFYRAYQRQKAIKTPSKLISLGALALSIGGLFALFGQSYQTGADPWQLFALWTLVQLPLFFCLPNWLSAVFIGITLNCTLWFMPDLHFITYKNDGVSLELLALNVLLILAAELGWRQIADPHRIASRIFNLIFIFVLVSNFYAWRNESGILLALAACAIAGIIYYAQRFDPLLVVVYLLSAIALFDFMLLINVLELALFGVPIFTAVAGLLGLMGIRDKFVRLNPAYNNHWALSFGMGTIGIVVALMVALVFFLFTQSTALIWIGAGVMLYLGFSQRNNTNELLSGGSLILAQCLALTATLMTSSYHYDYEFLSLGDLALIVSLLHSIVFFAVKVPNWARSLSLAITLSTWEELTISQDVSFGLPSVLRLTLETMTLLGFIWQVIVPKANERLVALNWGLVVALAYFQLKVLQAYFLFRYATVNNIPINWNVLLTPFVFNDSFSFVVRWLRFLVPALALGYLAVKKSLNKRTAWKIALLWFILLYFYVWIGSGYLWLSLLAVAYFMPTRNLLALVILVLLSQFGKWYYFYPLSFALKALFFALFGVVALMGFWLFKERRAQETQNLPKRPLEWKTKLAMMVITLTTLGVLAGVNQKIFQYENVLNAGTPIVLEITPEDPRSLMQGDYMELRYKLTAEAGVQVEPKVEGKRYYALVRFDENAMAQLCRVEKSLPTNFEGCEKDLYLPLKARGWNSFELPSQDYFFPQEKAEHYSQAKYAEYRFKDGILLLYRLLDESLQLL